MIDLHPGYRGMFTRDGAPGAIPNGTRIVKVLDQPGDAHKVGDRGTVLGSIAVPGDIGRISPYFYFVEWDNLPKTAVGVACNKIREA